MKGKAKVEKDWEALSIEIPSPKIVSNILTLPFLLVMMGIYIFIFSHLLKIAINARFASVLFSLISIFIFLLVSFSFVMEIGGILWCIEGREKLVFQQSGEFAFSKTIFGIGIKRWFYLNSISEVAFSGVTFSTFSLKTWKYRHGFGPGKIRIVIDNKNYFFGLALFDAEAEYLIDEIRDYVSKNSKEERF